MTLVLSTLSTCYLFFGGAGAGLAFVAAVLSLMARMPRLLYKNFLAPMYALAALLLALGAICLTADLGDMSRAVLLLFNPTLTFVSVGSWVLGTSLLLAVVLFAMWVAIPQAPDALVRALEVALAATSLATMAYTGLLLQSINAVPLWTTWWVPALFVASSLSCGVALALVVPIFADSAELFSGVLQRVAKADTVVVLAEVLIAGGFIASLAYRQAAFAGAAQLNPTEAAAQASVANLFAGEHAWQFWLLFVGLGLVVPLILRCAPAFARFASRSATLRAYGVSFAFGGSVYGGGAAGSVYGSAAGGSVYGASTAGSACFAGASSSNDLAATKTFAIPLVSAACVLVGAFAMRWCIVQAGMQPVVSTVTSAIGIG